MPLKLTNRGIEVWVLADAHTIQGVLRYYLWEGAVCESGWHLLDTYIMAGLDQVQVN